MAEEEVIEIDLTQLRKMKVRVYSARYVVMQYARAVDYAVYDVCKH